MGAPLALPGCAPESSWRSCLTAAGLRGAAPAPPHPPSEQEKSEATPENGRVQSVSTSGPGGGAGEAPPAPRGTGTLSNQWQGSWRTGLPQRGAAAPQGLLGASRRPLPDLC